ncbi:MAG: hypothetical protein KGL39_17760 [Patescibacteria group bacterium]|nr:hypothetical protein [Patescibacteria group bacterium]
MKSLKLWIAVMLGTLAAGWDRLTKSPLALPNELGTFNEHGIESQIIDPASANLPVSSRYLLYTRGATGTGYVDLCGAATLPLGASSDSPYQIGDIVNIRRLGARPGLELGIPATAFTVDDLVLTAANGKIQTFNAVANGTYYIVGRCAKTVPNTGDNIEVPYVPCTPIKITVNAGVGTIVVA